MSKLAQTPKQQLLQLHHNLEQMKKLKDPFLVAVGELKGPAYQPEGVFLTKEQAAILYHAYCDLVEDLEQQIERDFKVSPTECAHYRSDK